jgi:MGT family glycosyltransferase
VEPLFPELFPRGLLAAEEQLGTLQRRWAITRRYRALLDRLLVGSPLALDCPEPALLLVDITQTQIALWARFSGVPFIYLNTSLPQTKDRGVPPLRSALPFGADVAGRARAELAWRKFVTKRRAGARAASLAGMAPPYALARSLAPRFGVQPRELDSTTTYMPQLRGVPEIVLCAKEFDFPRPECATRHHAESVDLERLEADFDWSVIPANKTLLYCSLGGQRYRAEHTPRFFARLIEAVARRPDYHLLLSVGRHVTQSALAGVAANVTVVSFAPQLAVLSRASLMVTHGGLGSVKECIAHAVPMLVCPLDVDQPGNAARVEHHGIGLRADVRDSSSEELLTQIDRLLDEPSFRARCAELSARFRELETVQPGAAIVERFLG